MQVSDAYQRCKNRHSHIGAVSQSGIAARDTAMKAEEIDLLPWKERVRLNRRQLKRILIAVGIYLTVLVIIMIM